DRSLQGTALLFAEKEHFDDERQAKATRKKMREMNWKRKGDSLPITSVLKRCAVNTSNSQVATSYAQPTASIGDHGDGSDGSDEDATPPMDGGLQGLKDLVKGDVEVPKYTGKQQKSSLDVAMVYLINAEKHDSLMCRRKVFDVSFDNNAADSDHLDCNKEERLGCKWCSITPPTICCDIHHPEHFSQYTSHIEMLVNMPPHSCIPKYQKTVHDLALQETLDDWREQKTASTYGRHHLNDLGPSLVFPNAILDWILDCTHHRKIQSVYDLKWETGWTDAEVFGEKVITLIKQHAAPLPSPFVTTPLRSISTTSFSNMPPTQSPSNNQCGTCGLEGHNARNRVCEQHPSRSGQNKENVMLVQHLPT
ncbi:hypothetical protein F4604DRAFT_1569558, partial [Suillus subluteus]